VVVIGNPDGIGFTVTTTDGGALNAAQAVAAGDATVTDDISAANGTNLNFAISATDGPGSVTIQFGIDTDGDGTLDNGEVQSAVRTVEFKDAGDLTFTPALTNPVIGDTTIVTEVTVSHNVNITQVNAGSFALAMTDAAGNNIGDSDALLDGPDASHTGFALNADKDALTLTVTHNRAADAQADAFTAGQKAVAQITYTNQNGDNPTSAKAQKVVASTDMTALNDTATATTNLIAAANKTVRAGYTGSVTLTYKAIDGGNADAAVAGEKFDVTISENGAGLDADSVISSNGSTLADGGNNIEYVVTSGTDGVVTLTLSNNQAKAGDKIQVAVVSQTDPSIDETFTVEWSAATIADIVVLGYTEGNSGLVAADDSSASFNTVVVDNFGARVTGDYRVKATVNGVITTSSKVQGGNANVAITTDGGNDAAIEVQILASDGNYYDLNDGNNPDGAAQGADVDDTVEITDSSTLFALTSLGMLSEGDDGDETVDVLAEDVFTGNLLTDPLLSAGYNAADDDAVEFTFAAVDGGGTGVPSTITLSATGLLFSIGDKLYAEDSITFKTVADGTATVQVYGNKSGDYVVTATSGSVTEKLNVTIDAADETTATNVTLNIENAAQGKTMTVSGIVTDAYGNLIDNSDGDLTITYTGPGFINGALPTETDANGAYKFQVLIGASDVVEGSVKVVLDGDSDDDNTDAETVTVEKDLVPAAPATKVNAGSFKGYVAIYAKGHAGKRLSAKVGKDWVVVPALASNFVRVVEYTGAGYTIAVRIYIDRVLVDTITVVTK